MVDAAFWGGARTEVAGDQGVHRSSSGEVSFVWACLPVCGMVPVARDGARHWDVRAMVAGERCGA